MNAKLMKKPIMNITIWKKILDFVKKAAAFFMKEID